MIRKVLDVKVFSQVFAWMFGIATFPANFDLYVFHSGFQACFERHVYRSGRAYIDAEK